MKSTKIGDKVKYTDEWCEHSNNSPSIVPHGIPHDRPPINTSTRFVVINTETTWCTIKNLENGQVYQVGNCHLELSHPNNIPSIKNLVTFDGDIEAGTYYLVSEGKLSSTVQVIGCTQGVSYKHLKGLTVYSTSKDKFIARIIGQFNIIWDPT